MATFTDIYISECESCGADLSDWEWLEDDLVFHTSCTCGNEYTIRPTEGMLTCEHNDEDLFDEDDELDDDE